MTTAHALALLLALAGADDKPRVDCFGDPLPDGALARLGTTRLRHDAWRTDAVALSADHATLVTVAAGDVYVWDAAGGALLREIKGERVAAAALAPDGAVLACANRDGRVWLMDLSTGKETRRLQDKEAGGIAALAFSPDGKKLAAGARRSVLLWDLAGDKEPRRWEAYPLDVTRLSFSRDGSRLAAGCAGPFAQIVDTTTGKILYSAQENVVLAPDGKTAAVGAGSSAVSLWDLAGRRTLRTFKGDGTAEPRFFSPDGKTLTASEGDRKVCLWDVGAGVKRAELYGVPCGFSADGKVLAVLGGDDVVRLCDGATGDDLHSRFGHSDAVMRATFSPDGRFAATVGLDERVCLWDAATGRLLHARPAGTFDHGYEASLTFSSDGKSLAYLGDRPRRWDVESGKERESAGGRPEGRVRTLAASPDGRAWLLSRPGRTLRLWDATAGKEVRRLNGEDEGKAEARWRTAAFSPDGSLVAAVAVPPGPRGTPATYDGPLEVGVWQAATGRRLRTFTAPCEVAAVAEWPSVCLDREAVTVVMGRTVHTWDLGSARELPQFAPGRAVIDALALSPDGQLLAAAEAGRGVRLWETATRQPLGRWEGHRKWVTGLVFSPDGRTLLTTSGDATALLWDVAGRPEKPLAAGTAAERDALWADLADDDAARAHRAVQALAADPAHAAPYLKDKLPPAPVTAARRRIARLVADLDADDFTERERATDDLAKLGRAAGPALRAAAFARPSVEARTRIEDLLDRQSVLSTEEVRSLRAVRALEWSGAPEAREVLAGLAGGAEGAIRTEAARGALARLEKRPAAP